MSSQNLTLLAQSPQYAPFNNTIPYGIYPNCTLKVDCFLGYLAHIDYYPSLGGNAFYLSLFALLFLVQLAQGIRWKTWSYTITMLFGLILECVGYGGRVALSGNPFIFNSFLIYLIPLTVAPVFLTAAIYLSLGALIPYHDPTNTLSRLAPKTYTYLFIGADFTSLILQAVGGGLSATAKTQSSEWTGVRIMIGGLAFQVVSLFAFLLLCGEFGWRVYTSRAAMPASPPPYPSSSSKPRDSKSRRSNIAAWEIALGIATLAISIRSIFRCAELKDGFGGRLANEEVPFMVLEGGMISLAAIVMTLCHPGWVLERGAWGAKGRKADAEGWSAREDAAGVEMRGKGSAASYYGSAGSQ